MIASWPLEPVSVGHGVVGKGEGDLTTLLHSTVTKLQVIVFHSCSEVHFEQMLKSFLVFNLIFLHYCRTVVIPLHRSSPLDP